MEVIELQPTRGKPVERWRLDRAAECAGAAEANIVNQHDHDIGSILGRLDLKKRRFLFHIANVEFAISGPLWLLDRQLSSIEFVLCGNYSDRDEQKGDTQ